MEQGVNLPWWAPAYKIIWTFGLVVLWNHVINENHYILTVTVSMATKIVKKVIYLDKLQPKKSHDPLITWSYEIT